MFLRDRHFLGPHRPLIQFWGCLPFLGKGLVNSLSLLEGMEGGKALRELGVSL
jgi:hypothetical protein